MAVNSSPRFGMNRVCGRERVVLVLFGLLAEQ
jgi:hypothetical protein